MSFSFDVTCDQSNREALYGTDRFLEGLRNEPLTESLYGGDLRCVDVADFALDFFKSSSSISSFVEDLPSELLTAKGRLIVEIAFLPSPPK